nr:hypothetical protein GCM10025732_27210 [Glycomyces mayteni]
MASKQAQRLAARQHLQQRMAVKAEEERRRRTVAWSVGGVGALAALVLLAWGAFAWLGPDDESAGDPDVQQLVNDAEAAADRCGDVEPSGEGATGTATEGLTDGRPVQDVYLECLQMTAPDASATASCMYTSMDGTSPVPLATEPAAGSQEMTIVTNLGLITADIETAEAPCTAGSFTFLAQDGYFDGQQCHRLTTEGIYVLQCGDPDARAAIEAGTPEMAGAGSPATSTARRTPRSRPRRTTRPGPSRWPTRAPGPPAASSSSSTRTRPWARTTRSSARSPRAWTSSSRSRPRASCSAAPDVIQSRARSGQRRRPGPRPAARINAYRSFVEALRSCSAVRYRGGVRGDRASRVRQSR